MNFLFHSLYRHGFRRLLVVNGHGGNAAALASALHLAADDLPELRAKIFEWWTDAESYRVVTERLGPQQGSHASPGETAFMLAICPEAVHLERLTGLDATVQPSREFLSWRAFPNKYPDGIIGLDPRRATREVGRELLTKSIEICVQELENWQSVVHGKGSVISSDTCTALRLVQCR